MPDRPSARVVAALLQRDGRILAAQRPPGKARALLWELPGGKVEPGESDAAALRRECLEELGVELQVGELVWSTVHTYRDLVVTLLIYRAALPAGIEPEAREAHQLAWVELGRLSALPFCPADREFVAWADGGGLSPCPARNA